VSITLPFGAPSTQSVTVRATNFTGTVPIDIVLVPSSGAPVKYDATIAMNGQPTAQRAVNVEIQPNNPTRIWAWTR
jgi:hypothetical protein